MLDFVYNTPTKVFFGKDKHKLIGQIVQEYGYKKVMVQYGKGSVKKSGLLDEVLTSLREKGVAVVEMGGVEPNPKLSFVRKAVAIAKAEEVDLILAVGGGSVLDSCKHTALGAKNEADPWDFCMGKSVPTDALPVGVILTLSAAGSEMSSSAVLTNEGTNVKKGCNTEFNRCKFAILNPELTYTVSKYQTACGIVDMMSHTMERYFSPVAPTPLTDGIAESLLRSIVEAGQVAIDNPTDYEARATLMWASSLAHNGLTGCGREQYLAVHQLEHALSGMYDEVAHGAGLAVLYPAWMKFIYKYAPSRFAGFFASVFGAEGQTEEELVLAGIAKMEAFFTGIGMPTSLAEFGIPQAETERLALHCTRNKSIFVKSYIPLGYEEIKAIFDLCY